MCAYVFSVTVGFAWAIHSDTARMLTAAAMDDVFAMSDGTADF